MTDPSRAMLEGNVSVSMNRIGTLRGLGILVARLTATKHENFFCFAGYQTHAKIGISIKSHSTDAARWRLLDIELAKRVMGSENSPLFFGQGGRCGFTFSE
jgi:hypothetical protein